MRGVAAGSGSATYGIVGHPLTRTLSPRMQNAAFRALGMPAVYFPLPLPPGGLKAGLRRLVGEGVAGLNVTTPFKREAFGVMDVLTPSAVAVGAVNAVRVEDGARVGTNTDGEGLLRDLTAAGWDVTGRYVVCLGSGGAARAVTRALGDAGAARISLFCRRPAEPGWLPDGRFEVLEWASLATGGEGRLETADLIVQATPLGADGQSMAELEWRAVRPAAHVVDLLYTPARTPFLERAACRGCRVRNGLGMLVYQGALSFEFWTGVSAPVGVMANAVGFGLRAGLAD